MYYEPGKQVSYGDPAEVRAKFRRAVVRARTKLIFRGFVIGFWRGRGGWHPCVRAEDARVVRVDVVEE